MNRLLYEHEGKQVEIPLADKPVSLGRSNEANHRLPTKTASRLHAQVMPRDGGWWIEDLHSSNGTIVNGRKIEGATELSPGDVIILGDFKLTFDGDAKPKGPPDHLIARLLYTPEDEKTPTEVLIRDRVTIGRKKDNTLRIDIKAVSGHHCELLNREGTYLLRDLGSSNGTYVNKQPVTEHTLRNGETVLLGKVVPLYFVDPAAPAGSAPPAPGASDRGEFEPVPVAPAKPPARSPAPALVAGLIVGGLFVLAGWLLGDVIRDMRAPKAAADEDKPKTALADVAFSFEGEIDDKGNPDGWNASFEAPGGATAELLSDPESPYDGERSLSVSAQNLRGAATLVLTTQKARPVELGAACRVRVYARAEGAQRIALALSVLDEMGRPYTVATGSFAGLRAEAWVPLEMSGQILAPPPATGELRLLVCGSFTRLWLDRLEIEKLAGESVAPLAKASGPELRVALDPKAPMRLEVGTDTHAAQFTPRLLSGANDSLSEPDLWAVASAGSAGITYSALIPRHAGAAGVQMQAAARLADYSAATGVELSWALQDSNADSLAVEIELPLPEGAAVLLADRRGAPIEVNRGSLHTYAYSTVSELAITGLSVSFPEGAVLWLDVSRPGRLTAIARAAGDTRRALRLVVYAQPLMFARLYERVYDEALRLWEAEHGSAAKARLRYLASVDRPQRDLRVVGKAVEKLKELETARTDQFAKMDAAFAAADDQRTPQTVMQAEQAVRRYLSTWPGEEVAEVEARLKTIAEWHAEIEIRKRTPQEQQQAESIARRLWKDAEESHKAGRTLLTLVLLENLLKFYKGTSAYPNAEVLWEEANKKLNDPIERDRVIDAELAAIDEDLQFKDYGLAKKRCLKLFERFPDTPRNRDIMQRLRKAEAAAG